MSKAHWLLPQSPYSSYREYLKDKGQNIVEVGRQKTPEKILSEVLHSGLRGRGGAGFPTGVKWRTLFQHSCKTRYIVCNAAEGEPGTFKDRTLMRSNPYAILEGLWIAAHVIRAKKIYVGMKGSFEREIQRLQQAVEELQGQGFWQQVPIEIIEGPEEYLFGEEKGLLNFIEEGSPLPREAQYPPYERGLFGDALSPNPALVNNCQTFAHIPSIIRHGAESFRKLGTPDTPGTLLFTVSGDVKKPGVYEVEAGISLRSLFYEVAGGPRKEEFKVILSGVSCAAITPDKLDTHADFGSLALIGSGLGSAGFIVYDQTRSMPRLAQAVARFLYVESCNQCTACKFGLRKASKALDTMFERKGTRQQAPVQVYEEAIYGARSAPQGNRCYLPVEGSLLIPYLMEKFKSEFDAVLQKPAKNIPAIPVPLLKDYDEKTHTFVIDESFSRKKPDWSYSEAKPRKKGPKAVSPSNKPHGPYGIHLAPDVLKAIRSQVDLEEVELEQWVNDLLRKHLKG